MPLTDASHNASPSAVVQTALAQLVSRHDESRAYAQPPELTAELATMRDAARDRLVSDGRAHYQQGYEQGVRLGGELTWAQLDHLVAHGAADAASSCARFAAEQEITPGKHPDGARPVIDPQILVPYLGSIADWTGSVPWEPHKVTVEGLDRALRDLWADIRSAPTSRDGGGGTPSTPPA